MKFPFVASILLIVSAVIVIGNDESAASNAGSSSTPTLRRNVVRNDFESSSDSAVSVEVHGGGHTSGGGGGGGFDDDDGGGGGEFRRYIKALAVMTAVPTEIILRESFMACFPEDARRDIEVFYEDGEGLSLADINVDELVMEGVNLLSKDKSVKARRLPQGPPTLSPFDQEEHQASVDTWCDCSQISAQLVKKKGIPVETTTASVSSRLMD
ncbi:hypothetical protein FOZ60_015402 [Perkinsus olseni]|uniref:Uncharacterized protein n=1 Tax=Perkinsus olseni TaxID=32597 RepID=A0A7J6N8E2_PEROL|nr:hypothetical protein FOZ60_015402 [Perkinsus olseni]